MTEHGLKGDSNDENEHREERTLSILANLIMNYPWSIQDSSPQPKEAVNRASQGGTQVGEIFLDHEYTGATMGIQIHTNNPQLQFTVDQPLDPSITDSFGVFTEELAEAHKQIVSVYADDDIDALSSTSTILRAEVPANYSQSKISVLFMSIEAIVLQTAHLHENIKKPLQWVI